MILLNKDMQACLDIMTQLRAKCPWDKVQTFKSLVPHTLEEAYEVADAIEQQDWAALKSELGDLLFQVVFYAQLGEEADHFDFSAIVSALNQKLITRHPHVFATEIPADTPEAHLMVWEDNKAKERAKENQQGTLDGLPLNLTALSLAQKIQKRVARVGFDWPDVSHVFDKIQEELSEVQEAQASHDVEAIQEELGDLLFACVNLVRHAGFDAEQTLRLANQKFTKRFKSLESLVSASNQRLGEVSLTDLEQFWAISKQTA